MILRQLISSQSGNRNLLNFGNKMVVLDRKPQFGPLKKRLHVYDGMVVARR